MKLPPAACDPPSGTTLPPHLVVDFWYRVHATLTSRYGLSDADGAIALVRFRADTDHLVRDARYHESHEEVAETIALAWQNGSLQRGIGASVPPAGVP